MDLACIGNKEGIIGIAEILGDFRFVDIGFTVLFDAVAVFVLKIAEDTVIVDINEGRAGYIVNAESDPTQADAADILNLIDVVDEVIGN